MRLPQSNNQLLSVRVASVILLLALATIMPLGAQAATQQLVCSPSGLRFGKVQVGQSETQLIALTNIGQTSVTISAERANPSQYSVSGLNLPAVLTAGQSVTLSVIFAPTAIGWVGGTITFTSNASNSSLQLSLAGSGVTSDALTAAPSSLSFGQVAVGASAALSVVLTNPGASSETLKALQLTGTQFSVSGLTLPMKLAAGQSVTMKVSFTPLAAGLISGSVFVSGPSLNVPLSGTGTTTSGQLIVSPAALNFGNVFIDSTGTQTGTLSATSGSVTVSSAASSSAQFSLVGASFPLTIGAGQNVQYNVTFTPQSAGTASATLSFSSNATNSQVSEILAGTGAAPQVSLTWLPSTSQVSGYNVYRGTAPGVYSRVNATLDPTTSFTDSTVVPGATYYYAATAVNSNGDESTYSAAVEIVVP